MSSNKCQICAHRGHGRGGLYCTSCARAAVYSLRLHHAQTLLDREGLASQIAQLTNPASDKPKKTVQNSSDHDHCAESSRHASIQMQTQQARDRTELASRQAAKLRAALKQERDHLARRRTDLARRRRNLEANRSRLAAMDRAASTASVTLRSAHPFDDVHKSITFLRAQHLRMLSFWSRLERSPKSGARPDETFEYKIGGLALPDLRTLNHLRDGQESQLSAVLAHLCRTVYLAATYLQVRLPAEMIPPHRDWPLPMILSPLSSYSGKTIAFPYKSLISPTSSRVGRSSKADEYFATGPRPRLLYLPRPIKQMASDDPTVYNRFIEAVALLAWNVAWLCRVEGLPVADEKWEDACGIGRNLWMLLNRRTANTFRNGESSSGFGLYSHATAQNFLRAGSNTGAQARTMDVSMRGWPIGNPVKIVSELRATLLGELAIMEAVLVGDDGEELESAENGMQLGASEQRDESDPTLDAGADRLKGTSGWMKLRNRT